MFATKTIPLAKARNRLAEIVKDATSDKMWVITKYGQPRVAVVDVAYLNHLLDCLHQAEQNNWYELVQASLGRIWDHPDEDLYTLEDGEAL